MTFLKWIITWFFADHLASKQEEAEELRQLIRETEEDEAWMDFGSFPEQPEPTRKGYEEIAPELGGVLPEFEWLMKGRLFKKLAQEDVEEFIDMNSETLMGFENPRYLGSGAIADAWLEGDNRVLKIFDRNTYPGASKPPFSYYEDMMDAQRQEVWSISEDPGRYPMIYEVGEFKNPDGFSVRVIFFFACITKMFSCTHFHRNIMNVIFYFFSAFITFKKVQIFSPFLSLHELPG